MKLAIIKKKRTFASKKIRSLIAINKMKTNTLSKETIDKIGFISYIVPEFAKSYKMSMPASYQYLKKYGAWDYLNENWWALHTENPFWTVRYLYDVCYENGGPR